MASRSMNTMAEALQGLMQSLTEMKGMPDADLQWIIGLETQVLQKIREPFDGAAGQMGGGPPGNVQPAPGSPMAPSLGPSAETMPTGVGGPGMPMPSGGRPGPLPGGLRVGPASPNPDEIRRMVSGG